MDNPATAKTRSSKSSQAPSMTRSNSSSSSSVGNDTSLPRPRGRPGAPEPLGAENDDGGRYDGDEDYADDVDEEGRAMSPRRTNEDIEALEREARDQLMRHAKALQDSLLSILHRIEAVKEEHDKLDNHNKFLQKYIGDLMSTSKITASGGRSKK